MTRIQLLAALIMLLLPSILLGDTAEEIKRRMKNAEPEDKTRAIREIANNEPSAFEKMAVFLCDPHPRVRGRAVDAFCTKMDKEGAAAFLTEKFLKTPGLSPESKCAAAECLGGLGRGADSVIQLANDQKPSVRSAATKALGGFQLDTPISAQLVKSLCDTADEVRVAAVDALAASTPEELRPMIGGIMQDKSPNVRIACVEAAARLGGMEGLGALSTGLSDPAWQVRAATVDSLAANPSREGVGLLVKAMDTAQGRILWDIHTALVKSSGKEIGCQPLLWKSWWAATGDRFVPVGGGIGAPQKPMIETRTANGFYGIHVTSKNLAFVLDMSGSMRNESGKGGPAKADLVKAELCKVIKGFEKDVKFNIILLGSEEDGSFNRKEKVFEERLVQATDAVKEKALKFSTRIEPKGWTNLYDAILLAFEDEAVDTIFLLSDGVPSKGVFVTSGEIEEHLAKENRFRRIRVHTIEVGTSDAGERLMKKIAAVTGGISENK